MILKNTILLTILAIAFSSMNTLAEKSVDELLVILAYPKEAKISDKSCSFFLKNKNSVCMDGVVELLYEVGEVLTGNYSEKEIDIIDFVHHSGFPGYLSEFPVYLALIKKDEHYFLGQAARLESINEIEWVCGDDLNPLVLDNSVKAPPYVNVGIDECFKGVEFLELKKYFKEFK